MNQKYKKAIMLAILSVVAIALFDVLAAHSGVFGTYQDYTNGEYSPGWWPLFFKTNLILLSLIPIAYYLFGRRDKSESIALFFTSITLWFTGLADVFYFLLQGKMVPETLPWLNHGTYGLVSLLMGLETITRTSLFVTVAIGFVAVYFITKQMEKI